jgi:hypothetical protein
MEEARPYITGKNKINQNQNTEEGHGSWGNMLEKSLAGT